MNSIKSQSKGIVVLEGAGVPVTRILPSPNFSFDLADPFLLLDRVELSQDLTEAFPRHPHRGFEIITYLLDGDATHSDSAGHLETLQSGDIQKITAGKGLWHEEGSVEGKPFSGLQLWVNLKKSQKSIPPSYQILRAANVPTTQKSGITIKEIVGGKSPLKLQNPTFYLDITMEEGSVFKKSLAKGFNTLLYLLKGELSSGKQTIPAENLAVLQGGQLSLSASTPSRFILISSKPLNEPVIWDGPFVD